MTGTEVFFWYWYSVNCAAQLSCWATGLRYCMREGGERCGKLMLRYRYADNFFVFVCFCISLSLQAFAILGGSFLIEGGKVSFSPCLVCLVMPVSELCAVCVCASRV